MRKQEMSRYSRKQKVLKIGETSGKKCLKIGKIQDFPHELVPKTRSNAKDVFNSWTGQWSPPNKPSGPAG